MSIRLFILFNIVDFTLTLLALSFGIGSEGNPLLTNSIVRIALIKLVVVLLVLRYLSQRRAIIKGLNIGLAIVCAWNVTWLIVVGVA